MLPKESKCPTALSAHDPPHFLPSFIHIPFGTNYYQRRYPQCLYKYTKPSNSGYCNKRFRFLHNRFRYFNDSVASHSTHLNAPTGVTAADLHKDLSSDNLHFLKIMLSKMCATSRRRT